MAPNKRHIESSKCFLFVQKYVLRLLIDLKQNKSIICGYKWFWGLEIFNPNFNHVLSESPIPKPKTQN